MSRDKEMDGGTRVELRFSEARAIPYTTGKGKGKVHPRTGHEGPEGE